MRLAVLATSRHPVREPWTGGQEAHTGTLARGLRARGHHVRLYAREGTDPSLADEIVTYPDLPPLSAISALDPHLPEPDFLRDHAAFTAAMTDVVRRADVDVVHNQSLHHLPLSMSTALPVPVVATLHTPPFPWMELGVALADARTEYVCVSRASAADWTTLPRPATVIPNGVPVPPGPVSAGGPDLLWFGRITPEKGVDLALAVARLAGRRLRLAGPVGDPGYFDEVVRPALGPRVEYLGHLASDALGEVIATSAVTVVTPRWDEPFGLVAADSMVRGTPVLALGRGGLVEVVGPRGGVLVPGQGPEEDQVRGLVAAMPRAESLSRPDVARWARGVLGEATMVERYDALLRDVVDRRAMAS